MVMVKQWDCPCVTCLRFRIDHWWDAQNRRCAWVPGTCGICGNTSDTEEGRVGGRLLAPWVPDVVAEFFGTRDVCWCCRNVIHGYLRSWRVCLSGSTDESIKWALADMVLDYLYKMHLPVSGECWSGWRQEGGFTEHPCCATGHGARSAA